MSSPSFAWLAWLWLLASACTQNDAPLFISSSRPIMNGIPDRSPAHGAVVAISDGALLCSGTLVTPRVVLTAGHCVYGADPANYIVYFGWKMDGAIQRRVAEGKIHPAYDPGTPDPWSPPVNDLALLRLSEPPPAGVDPIPVLPASLQLTSADLGKMLTFVGFGENEAGETGDRLRVDNDLGWLCPGPDYCMLFPGAQAAPRNMCQDQKPGGPCSGDSGGPALIQRDGKEYVAGVTSFGDQSCHIFGCSTQADAFQQWVEEYAAGELGSACREGWECQSGFCARGTCCETACDRPCDSCAIPGSLGVCRPVMDGAPCSDGNVCNGEEICQGNVCLPGTPLVCQDELLCTRDECDPLAGCVFSPLPDGTPCPDGNACNGEETCRAGVCEPGQELSCEDTEICTMDDCDPREGCRHLPVPDQTICGSSHRCTSGVCREEIVDHDSGCGCAGAGGPRGLLPAMVFLFSTRLTRGRRNG